MRKQFLDTVKLSRENPMFHVDELPYLQSHTVGNIISGPSTYDVDEISSSRVHKWIEARCAAQPDAIALSCAESGQQMTYAELDRTTNQIAHYLWGIGITAGETVAVHVNRGFALLLWTLGTLKAGGCFVVVDKALPTSRKQSILRTCEPVHLVTDTAAADELLSQVEKSPSVIVLDATFEGELKTYPVTHCNGPATANNDLAYSEYISLVSHYYFTY
jgi:non-ribosomal peptide synthetase component F